MHVCQNWLFEGVPLLTGAVMRLPAGILTDKFEGNQYLLFC
jgi:nitrate/nitrite transporter NarK